MRMIGKLLVSLSQKGNVDRIMGYEKEKQTEKGHAQER